MNVDTKRISAPHAGLSLRTAQWSDLNAVVDLVRDLLTVDGDAVSAVTPGEMELELKSEE